MTSRYPFAHNFTKPHLQNVIGLFTFACSQLNNNFYGIASRRSTIAIVFTLLSIYRLIKDTSTTSYDTAIKAIVLRRHTKVKPAVLKKKSPYQ